MIAACPKCEARYRIEREKLGSEGVRLRCSKCQSVFRVRAPAPAAGPRSVAPAPPPPPIPAAPAESHARPASSLPSPPPLASPSPRSESPLAGADSAGVSAADSSAATPAAPPVAPVAKPGEDAPLVLVATPDENVAKLLRESLETWGIRAAIVSDGVEAMLEIQRQLPDVVVLAPTLPRMYGFQVCEIVKRNESLQGTGVILLGAIHHPDRYRRPPEELYGADAYVEEPDLPEALLPELRRLGIASTEAPAEVPEPAARAEARTGDLPSPTAPASVEVPAAEAPPSAVPRAPSEMASPPDEPAEPGDELSEARAQAERLARIIVSDIVLYNEEKFAAAIEAGTVARSLGPDLEEGRGLFRDRVDPRLQDEKDYLTEELLRVARTRGMQ